MTHRSITSNPTTACTASHAFDVVIASDLRFPGGTSHSIAEEIAAQDVAGYRTGLIHLNGPLVKTLKPVNPLIREQVEAGAAELIVGARKLRTRVLVLRHPAVAQEALDQLPIIEADSIVVVANAGPRDVDGIQHYNPALVTQRIRERLGVEPLWAPIGPLVRSEIEAAQDPGSITQKDWVNIIDVSAWEVERPGWAADRPVVGRHSRPSRQKWPESAAVIQQVYPTDGSWDVRILGGAEPVEDVLGGIPQAWTVMPFGAISPKEFLAGLDFFVYYHDTRWVEAFGRTILEAIASGLPAVLPPHFERLFGQAALYAEPAEVKALIESLWRDRDRYVHHVNQARTHIRSTFGHEAHVNRLRALIGEPGGAVAHRPASVSPPRLSITETQHRPAPDRPRVLLMSSNGSGMGHLTRLLAYARRLDKETEPYFLSMSQAAPVVGRLGYPYEYLPSTKALGMAPSQWQGMFVDRVLESLDRIRPEVVIFDGTWPYNGIPEIRRKRQDIKWVWSRRGMWRKGANAEQIRKADWFDLVIEPGDFASPYDRGATVSADGRTVGPVTLLDAEELDSRERARQELGPPPDGQWALVSLGAGNINDTSSDMATAIAVLREMGVGVCVTRPEIANRETTDDDVHVVREYPLARRYAAFDLVISASGYNSFQELLRMGVPSLFVPNQATSLDDQAARAQYAADQGWAHRLDRLTPEGAVPLLTDLLDHGPTMVQGARQVDPGNGAAEAARLIIELANATRSAAGQS